jgi:hypothetical protein
MNHKQFDIFIHQLRNIEIELEDIHGCLDEIASCQRIKYGRSDKKCLKK